MLVIVLCTSTILQIRFPPMDVDLRINVEVREDMC